MTEGRNPTPASGEELNDDAAPSVPRQAATVIVLRGGGETLEVLLVKRNPAQRFMGGAWVFPGGAVDAHEGKGDRAHRAAAVREAMEEANVALPDPNALIEFSRWITPPQVKIRFDTHFFLAPLPEEADPRPDGGECVDLRFMAPADALRDPDLHIVFPTMKHLEQLEPFATADALLAWAEGREVVPVVPHIVMAGEVARVVLPGEPGYASEP